MMDEILLPSTLLVHWLILTQMVQTDDSTAVRFLVMPFKATNILDGMSDENQILTFCQKKSLGVLLEHISVEAISPTGEGPY